MVTMAGERTPGARRPAVREQDSGARRTRCGLLALALLATACGGGSGSSTPASAGSPGPGGGGGGGGGGGTGGSGGGGGGGGGGGTVQIPTNVGDEVGLFEVEAPFAPDFLLRGTLPLPPGVYPRDDGQNPFAVLDYDGTPVATQVEVVSRYPFERDGADIVELIAFVRKPPGIPSGARLQYKVVFGFTDGTPYPVNPSVSDLVDGTKQLPNNVFGLLSDTTSIEITTRDVFGNDYRLRPLEPDGSTKLTRYGDLHTQARTYGVMEPVTPVSGSQGTLPHFFGVHAYVSSLHKEQVVLMDLRFNNGPDGNDPGTDADDPMGRLYFEDIEIAVPPTWVVLQAFDDPYWGNLLPVTSGGKTRYKLVEPMTDGSIHVMPERGQFHRRLAICPPGLENRAQSYLEGAGQGFCRRGSDAGAGHDYFSWWNPATARYFPQKYLLPSLEHVGHANVRNMLANSFDSLHAKLVDGTGTGNYPIQAGVLGWAHPYGVSYGGMTGGDEIFIIDGVKTAESASISGYREFQLTHRMHSDRHANVYFDEQGEPTRIDDWLQSGPSFDHVTFHFYGEQNGGPDLFGDASAPTFQVQTVANLNREPPYEDQLLNFDFHDLQHLIRYTRSPKVLVYLGNDPLARDDLHMQAEVFRMGFHQYPNNAGGGTQETGLLFRRQYVDAHGPVGFKVGRGEGWGIDAMNVAYATGDEDLRANLQPWYALIAEVFADGQSACSGFIQAQVAPKMLDGQYRARQNIEQAILENALRGINENVFRDVDPAHAAMLDDTLELSYYSWLGVMAWDPAKKGPWAITAVGPADDALPPYCTSLPADNGHTPYIDTYQLWGSLAYGHTLTGDPVFLSQATKMVDGGSLFSKLQNKSLDNINNRASLLALVQVQNGVF